MIRIEFKIAKRSSFFLPLLLLFSACLPPNKRQIGNSQINNSDSESTLSTQTNWLSSGAYIFSAWAESVLAKHGKTINLKNGEKIKFEKDNFVGFMIDNRLVEDMLSASTATSGSKIFSKNGLLVKSSEQLERELTTAELGIYFEVLRRGDTKLLTLMSIPGVGSLPENGDYFIETYRRKYFQDLFSALQKTQVVPQPAPKDIYDRAFILADIRMTIGDLTNKVYRNNLSVFAQRLLQAQKDGVDIGKEKPISFEHTDMLHDGVDFSGYTSVKINKSKGNTQAIQKIIADSIHKAIASNDYVAATIFDITSGTESAVLVTDFVYKGEDLKNPRINEVSSTGDLDYFVLQNTLLKFELPDFLSHIAHRSYLPQSDALLSSVGSKPFFIDTASKKSRGFFPLKTFGLSSNSKVGFSSLILPKKLADELIRFLPQEAIAP